MPSIIRSLPGVSRNTGKDTVLIVVDEIHVREGWNPRKNIDHEKLEEFKEWIRSNGVKELPPVKVRIIKTSEGTDKIELVAGHRRLQACKELIAEGYPIAGLRAETVSTNNEAELLSLAGSENSNEPLTPNEEASLYKRLMNFNWDVGMVARNQGKSITHVYSRLELLQAEVPLATAIEEKEVPLATAVQIVKKSRKTGVSQEALLAHHKATHVDRRKVRNHPQTAENYIRSVLMPLVEKYGHDQVQAVLDGIDEFIGEE